MNRQPNILALFDFDKTIVSLDSGFTFIKYRLNSSIPRRLAAFAVSPLALFFYFPVRLRYITHSIFMWIATVGLRKEKLHSVRKEFVRFYCSHPNASLYQDAMDQITYHLDAGHNVYIVSGAPVWVIKKIFKRLQTEKYNIIGSTEKPYLGGRIYKDHCYGPKKLDMISHITRHDYHQIFGYTDSAADIPLLSICSHRHVINPTRSHLKKFRKAFGDDFTVLNWQ